MNINKILELPTPRLLAYFKKHYRNLYHNRFGWSEAAQAKYKGFESNREKILAELSTREHVE